VLAILFCWVVAKNPRLKFCHVSFFVVSPAYVEGKDAYAFFHFHMITHYYYGHNELIE
jgi:hypothetical protein